MKILIIQGIKAYRGKSIIVKPDDHLLKNSNEIYKFKFDNQQNLEELIKFYNSQSDVEYVEPNYLYQATLEPLDTYYTQQIYLWYHY